MSDGPRKRMDHEGGQAAFWNKRFAGDGYLFGTEPNDFFRVAIPPAEEGQTALAPADGEGRNGVFLAGLGYDVTTFDVSELAVQKALKLAMEQGVSLRAEVGDIFEWGWPTEAYDLVAVSFMHFLEEQRKQFHAAIVSALKPGGLLVLEGFHISQIEFDSGGPPREEMLFTRDIIASDFEALETILLQDTRRHLSEGPRDHGEAATVQYAGRKRPVGATAITL